MAFRNYNDSGAYRTRASTGFVGNSFGRSTPVTTSSLSNYRPYSSVGPASSRVPIKEKTISNMSSSYGSKGKIEEKPSLKYSCTKDPDKCKLNYGRISDEDSSCRSSLSNSRSSLLEKYSYPSSKISDRPSSVLDKYSRPASREKNREPENNTRYSASTYPGSGLSRSFTNDSRIEKKDHVTVPYKGLRPSSARASREPSPEVGNSKTNSFRAYSKGPTYGRSGISSGTCDTSSSVLSTRFGTTSTSRFLTPSRSGSDRTSARSYSNADKFRKTGAQKFSSNNVKTEDDTKNIQDSTNSAKTEISDIQNRLQENESKALIVVTRTTSPSPPASSNYMRAKRADAGIICQEEVPRICKNVTTKDQESQCDRVDEVSKYPRFSSTNRIPGTTWSSYLDKFASPNSTGNSLYSSRNFNSSSSSGSSRLNFGFLRTTETNLSNNKDSSKIPSVSNQDHNNTCNKSQTEINSYNKCSNGCVQNTDSNARTLPDTSLDNNSSNVDENDVNTRNQINIARNESVSECSSNTKSDKCSNSSFELDDSRLKDNLTNSRKDSASKESENPNSRNNSSERTDICGKRSPSIPKLGSTSPKNENKTARSSSKSEIPSAKTNMQNQKRSSTPKSDLSASSKNEESIRSENGFKKNKSQECITQKRECLSPRRDSSQSSGTWQSRSATPQSRSNSSKAISRQMTRTDSSDGSSVNVPIGKSKSSSTSSVTSQEAKIKTTQTLLAGKSSASSNASLVNLRQSSSPDARGKPPVPKNELVKYVNKDFRKSALNMDDGESSRTNFSRKKRIQRSVSVSSQDSQSEAYIESRQSTNSSRSHNSTKAKVNRQRVTGGLTKSKSRDSNSKLTTRDDSSRSGSKSPAGRKYKILRRSSSSASTEMSSQSSSSSDEADDASERSNCSNSGSRARKHRSSKTKISGASSRTSVLASSTDEVSLAMDKPPRHPSIPRSRSDRSVKTEDAKSFLMRALAPVTNLFKTKQNSQESIDESGRSGGWLDSSEENHGACKNFEQSTLPATSVTQSLSKSFSYTGSDSAGDKTKYNTRATHQTSDEKPWWLDPNSDNVPDGVERFSCNDDISQDTTVSTALPDDGKFKFRVWRQDSGDKNWWIDGSDNQTTSDEKKQDVFSNSPTLGRGSSLGNTYSTGRRNPIRHDQSGERAWWMSDDPENVPDGIEVIPVTTKPKITQDCETERNGRRIDKIMHVESGEKAWWMDDSSSVPDGIARAATDTSNSNSDSSESYEKVDIGVNPETYARRNLSRFPIEFPPPPPPEEPLGDRASPEGIENPPEPPDSYRGRASPYDNVDSRPRRAAPRKRPSNLPLFIGQHKNIDDLLGEASPCRSPVTSFYGRKRESLDDESFISSSECEEIDATQVIIHDSTPKTPVIQRRNRENDRPQPDGYIPLDDTALQLYKDGDYGAYLDLEASISEQQEEFEGFHANRKNSIVLRTQLSVRVHTIIEKLLNSEGRELRRALFSLKQIFQEDKDLVHEFVQNDGLACLIKVGSEADQNYQNYILRALGQVMLYVDGMNGVMEHGLTVQWLYTLIASRFRLVVKTALKLLLVFVEYVETNSLLLVRAVRSVDTSRGMIPWTNVMNLLKDYDAADTELLIYATTLVNKCLNGIPDQDTYYDQVDCLEEQGIEGIIQRYMSKQGTDLDLLRQFQIYEAVLHHEDGNDREMPIRQLDDNIRKTLRNRKSLVDSHERRKSRRHSTGTSPLSMSLNSRLSPRLNHSLGLSSLNTTLNSTLNNTLNSSLPDDDDESSSSQSSQSHIGEMQLNGGYKENKVDVGVTPALRRRRERAERQRSFIREQQEATASMRASIDHSDEQEKPFSSNGVRYTNSTTTIYDRNADSSSNKLSRPSSRKDFTPLMNAANKVDSEDKKPWYGRSPDEGVECDEGNHTDEDEDRRVVLQLKREGTVKDLTQKLAAQNLIPSSPVEEKVSRIGDMSGLISKAKEGLAKSKSKADVLKSPTNENHAKLPETKKSENELHWEELVKKLKRPLALCDLDFTDLNTDDEVDVLGPVNVTNGIPPPPPPMAPPPPGCNARAPPPPPPGARFPPPPQGPPLPLFGVSLKSARSPPSSESNSTPKSPPPTLARKSKKTVKLFWKEVRDDPIILSRLDKNKMIWDELSPVPVDTQRLEHLFESRAKDLITKKQQEMNKNKEIIVLDHKRSNAINIGMTKLPPPRSIKTAILKMDATIMNREGIEKLLTMLPTEEERSRIQEAQAANPDLPLGSAEQFLLTLASISELPARLKLWAFKLDFENSEKEIADPLMDLKQGMETLRVNKTFRGILSTLLSIGIFLNGNEVKGFQLEYLAKVPEVKDTVHKHSLLHHLCHMMMEKFPDSTDLYSEIGAVTRASKIDFDELASNIGKLESECKASWDHLKLIAKHDGSTMMKVKMSDFLADCAERIIVLGIVHRRIINRFHKFILWLGIPLHRVQDTKPNEFCRVVSEFALEYRTTRERVIQQLEKKANHRERNKTRGKMITEVGKFRTKEDRADAELRQLLGSDISDVESLHGTLPWRRQRKNGRTSLGPLLRDEGVNGNLTDGDDELLESLVKTATMSPGTRTTPRERKRTRHADRKSLRRTLKNGLSEEEKKHIAAYIKGY